MGNIVTAKVTIEGTRPLLWHVFGPDAIPSEGNRKERTGAAGNDPEEWRKTYTATKDGQLWLNPANVFGCIRDGAKHTKKGRGTMQAPVSATLQVMDSKVLTDRFMPVGDPVPDPELPVYLHICGVRNPATKGRNVRYRVAASLGWTATFSIVWDRTIVAREQMRSILDDAGTLVGIGDGRSIGFGRFAVRSFEVSES